MGSRPEEQPIDPVPRSPGRARWRRGGPWITVTVVAAVAVMAAFAASLALSGRSPGPSATRHAPSLPAAGAADLFVAPDGDDANPGTRDDPLAGVRTAIERIRPGGTIWLEPGTHPPFAITSADPSPLTIASRVAGEALIDGSEARAAVILDGARGVRLVGLTVLGGQGRGRAGVQLDRADDIAIEGSTIRDAVGGFGVEVRFSSNVRITGNDISGNAVGIRLFAEGDPEATRDVRVEGNWIHDNDSMVVNDPEPDNDFGGNAIIWHKVTGATMASGNQVWSNGAPSHDYGVDGGAFEIWASSNMVITGNTAWDNVNVVETGSDGPPCANLVFTRNIAYGDGSDLGLILRCAENGLVAHNVIDRIGGFAFELSDRSLGGSFATSVDGLRIVDNIVVGSTVYVIRNDVPGVVANHNLLWQAGGPLAKLPRAGRAATLADLTRATGFDSASVSADPLFVARASHDYRLLEGSPAVDAGVETGSVEDVMGIAPDIGAFEGAVPRPPEVSPS